jgi:hypothetical protein
MHSYAIAISPTVWLRAVIANECAIVGRIAISVAISPCERGFEYNKSRKERGHLSAGQRCEATPQGEVAALQPLNYSVKAATVIAKRAAISRDA